MTDEEFERIKEAEKEHLRAQKKLRTRLEALKKRNRAQSIVQDMQQGAQRLLRDTDALVDTLQAQVARSEARLEVAADLGAHEDLHEADQALREERAERLVQQYKAASGPVSTRSRRSGGEEKTGKTEATVSQRGTDKTIGRMRAPSTDEGPPDDEGAS